MTELRVHELLQAAYEGGEIAHFDYAAEKWPGDEGLTDAKAAADMFTSLGWRSTRTRGGPGWP